jgi:hypothetical protein
MTNISDSAYPVNINVLNYENFYNNYTAVDGTPADFTRTSAEPGKISIDTMRANTSRYVYRDNMALNDFTMVMEVGVTLLEPNPTAGQWGGFYGILFSKGASHAQSQCSTAMDCLNFSFRTSNTAGTQYFDCWLRQNFGTSSGLEWDGIIPWASWPITSPATPLWIKITRTGSGTTNDIVNVDVYDCDIIANPSCGVPLNGNALHNFLLPQTAGTLTTFVPVNSHGAGAAFNMSGYCRNCVFY